MNRTLVMLILTALAVAGCRSKSESAAMADMPGMTPAQGDTAAARQPVHLTPAQVEAIGVRYTVVERGPLERTVRTVGAIAPAESRLAEITTKIDGFVDRLFVNATGVAVRKGEPLLTLYSPMLVAAQEELLTARRLAASVDSGEPEAWRNAQALLEAARRRLAYWDISADQIERLERTGEATKTLTLVAPFDGVVLEKMVVEGQAVIPGMKLYRLADLSTVWIEGDVFEQDLALVRLGAPARVELAAYPGESFIGRVSFVWPVVDEQSRAGRVRVAVPNPGGRLKPGMYATLFFDVRLGGDLLSVPAQVLSGVKEGERIVASANFLVDAESRLGGGKGMAGMPGMNMEAPKERP